MNEIPIATIDRTKQDIFCWSCRNFLFSEACALCKDNGTHWEPIKDTLITGPNGPEELRDGVQF